MKRDCTHPRANHQHGTTNAYIHDRCRCDDCRKAHAANMKHRRRQIAYGRYNNQMRNPETTRKHIQALRKAGIVINQIAKLAGVSADTVGRISLRKATTITAETERKILALQPHPAHLAPNSLINSTGTARRLQALHVNGWGQTQLARILGIKTAQMWKITHQMQPVTKTLADQIQRLYDQLWNTHTQPRTPTEQTTMRRAQGAARKHGWLPALAWDEDRLDDPAHKGYRKEVAA